MSPSKLSIDYEGSQAASILSRSASQWQGALHQAMTMSRLPESCYQLEMLLCRIPKLPDHIPHNSSFIEGYSTWKSYDASCPLERKTEKPRKLHLRRLHPTIYTISTSDNFRVWEGHPNNGLALLVLGWAYVMTASLAERQHLSLRYALLEYPSGSVEINLDYASPQEITWWKAITARGSGFSISANSCYSPWAVLVDDLNLQIVGETCGIHKPPTASEAIYYLARFSDAYHLGSQCSAALAAALSLPLYGSVNPTVSTTIELPRPSLSHRFASPQRGQYLTDPKLLDHYMTLSLTPSCFGSTLWSVFWKPDVPCNFAGAWLGPISEVLRPIIQDNNLELLVKVLSFTNAAPLWLGIALCGGGAVIHRIMPFLELLRPYSSAEPFIDAAAWTGIPQSFMDIHPPGPYLQDGKVSRADVWRLRHDFHANYADDTFSTTPRYGWPPFGAMRFEDIELELHDHLCCSHQWKYEFWTWIHNGVRDSGFLNDKRDSLPKRLDYKKTEIGDSRIKQSKINFYASETATKWIFTWCSSQVEKGFGSIINR